MDTIIKTSNAYFTLGMAKVKNICYLLGNNQKVDLHLYNNNTKMKPAINDLSQHSHRQIWFMVKNDYWVYPGRYMHS